MLEDTLKDVPLVVVLDLPATLAVDILAVAGHHLVADDVKVVSGLVAEELLEQRTNDGLHAGGQNDDRNIVVTGPVVELLEVWVQLHVLQKRRDTLVVGGLDASEHLTESVTSAKGYKVRTSA